ncbi:hypothetical protein IAT38_002402 [Cryptococcus sp. DSM 104549]
MSVLPALPRRMSSRSTISTLPTRTAAPPPYDPSTLFRQSERLIATQACRVRTGHAPFVKADAILICSRSDVGDEAAVFIVAPPEDGEQASILYAIPIVPGFKHRLEQTPPSPSTSFFHQSAKPHITLYLTYEETKVELRIAATQTAKVQKLVAELRRLNDLASQTFCPATLSHSWMRLYPVQPPAEADAVDALLSPPSAETPEPEGGTPAIASPSESTTTLTTDAPTSTAPTPTTATSTTTAPSPLPPTAADPPTDTEDPFPDPYAPTFSRTTFLRKRVFASQSTWASPQDIKLRLATYNVNDKVPPRGTTELAGLVGEGEEDLIVVGLQEADLRSAALLVSQGNSRADLWEAALLNGLGARASEFEKLVMTQYVGVVMIVLVRKTIKEYVTRVETSEKGIGLLGFGGNKAGVAVRLQVYDTTVGFVNAHMAAFATALERRRTDYAALRTGLTFPRPTTAASLDEEGKPAPIVPAFEEFWPEVRDRLLTQDDCHLLFWMGDLNYRVDLPDGEVRALVKQKDWAGMLEKDQLRGDIKDGKSFAGFVEADVTFPPTFKYVHGSSTLDTRRAPAYTDRILWTSPSPSPLTTTPPLSPAPQVTPLTYISHPILWSDHRPVSLSLSFPALRADPTNRRAALQAANKELDKLEEVWRPSLEVGIGGGVEERGLEFGEVKWGGRVVREVRLRNNGRVRARFGFKAPGADKPICKPFFWPFPPSATVEPDGEMVLKVVLDVDEYWAARLTLGEDINDVLVLQVEGGKDTFITLQATFLPSIISLPLPLLSSLPSPITSLPLAERKLLARPPVQSGTNGDAPFRPVREVWRLLEFLMGEEVVALGSGVWVGEQGGTAEALCAVQSIIAHLSDGTPLPTSPSPTAHAPTIARALIHLLSSLPTGAPATSATGTTPTTASTALTSVGGLLPAEIRAAAEQVEERDGAFAVLEGVGQVVTNVLIGVMSVVRLSLGVERERAAVEAAKAAEREEKARVVEVGDEEGAEAKGDTIAETAEEEDQDLKTEATQEQVKKEVDETVAEVESKAKSVKPADAADAAGVAETEPEKAEVADEEAVGTGKTAVEGKKEEKKEEQKLEAEADSRFSLGDDDDDVDADADADADAAVDDTSAARDAATKATDRELADVPLDGPPSAPAAIDDLTDSKSKDAGAKPAGGLAAPAEIIPSDKPSSAPKPKSALKQSKGLDEEASLAGEDAGEKVVVFAEPPKKKGGVPGTPGTPGGSEEGKGESGGGDAKGGEGRRWRGKGKAAQDTEEKKEPVPGEQSEQLVDVLCPAVFGRGWVGAAETAKRRRFVRLLLEG